MLRAYWIAAAALVLACSAHALNSDGFDTPATATASPMGLGAVTFAEGPVLNGIYRVAQDTPIIPLKTITNGKTALNTEIFQIYKNQPFAVRLTNKNAYLTAIVPEEARGSVPETYVFSRKDLEQTDLIYVMDGDAKVLAANFTADADTEVAAGRCKYYVERHFGFHAGGMCASSLTAGVLSRVGFHQTSCSNAQMQVWGGGRVIRGIRCGHVAWRTGGGGWSSGDFAGNPGHGYYSTGCYSR